MTASTAETDGAGWVRCVFLDATETRCTGIEIAGTDRCLAHLTSNELELYLNQLVPGAEIDLRGTSLDSSLQIRLRIALTQSSGLAPLFGASSFDGATFTSAANFSGATFAARVSFAGATFAEGADFGEVNFGERASFRDTTFGGDSSFGSANFAKDAEFHDVRFLGNASFRRSSFRRFVSFAGVTFAKRTHFHSASFDDDGSFRGATFVGDTSFDEATFTMRADFNDTAFGEDAAFLRTTFLGRATFRGATFAKHAEFDGTTFDENAAFDETKFTGSAGFRDVTFSKIASFTAATFIGFAGFRGVTFTEHVDFQSATFAENALFDNSIFTKDAYFNRAVFAGLATFEGARFLETERLTRFVADSVVLDRAVFGDAVVIEVEAGQVSCHRTRFAGGVELQVRYGKVDLTEASFGAASSLSTSTPAESRVSDERLRSWREPFGTLDHRPVVTSLRGIDVTNLALTDCDLRWCHFAGAHHLDKLRIEGDTVFPRPPRRWWRASRQVLFEEYPWRQQLRPHAGWDTVAQLEGPAAAADPVGAQRLAALYRSLRKALEDGKNEAGAGDFYYGEQEARRRIPATSRAERAVLWGYWLISGYGQRASRALAALAVLVVVVTTLLIGFGLPGPVTTAQTIVTVQPASGGIGQQTITTSMETPAVLPPGGERWTWSRIETSTRIGLGAVVFRDAGQRLTPVGTWTVMVARFLGPVLLALAALAIRARVKR